jgi:hypothetical protein
MSVSSPSKLSARHLIAILVKIRAGEVMLCVTSPVANTFPGRLYAFKGLAGINLFTQVAIVLELALVPSQHVRLSIYAPFGTSSRIPPSTSCKQYVRRAVNSSDDRTLEE